MTSPDVHFLEIIWLQLLLLSGESWRARGELGRRTRRWEMLMAGPGGDCVVEGRRRI